MRIAYLVHFRGGADTGIFRKVATQADEWTRRGHDVGLFVATDRAVERDWRALPEVVAVVTAGSGAGAMLLARERLASRLLRWCPEVVYARHTLAYPGLIRIARRRPTVFEINSDDIAEFRLVSARRYRLAIATRGMLLSRAAGLVFVTRELQANPAFERYGRPSVVIANGARLADYPVLPAPANPVPRLIFLGHPHSPWHGLDLVEEMARAFPEWEFDVVGPGVDELSAMAPANLSAHGVLGQSAYRPLLGCADVAIGTLGLYRKAMDEASPIKTREYLASGLPVVIGYRDTDFPDGAPFLLEVPNRATGVADSLRAIRAFVTSWHGRRVPLSSVTELDIDRKETERLSFLAEVAVAHAPAVEPGLDRSRSAP